MRLSVLVLSLAMISGCESYDLRATSSLAPLSEPGRYRWQTSADAVYPIDDVKAEAARRRQLAEIMRLNPQCQGGYRIVDRTATRKTQGLLGDVYDVFYTVQC